MSNRLLLSCYYRSHRAAFSCATTRSPLLLSGSTASITRAAVLRVNIFASSPRTTSFVLANNKYESGTPSITALRHLAGTSKGSGTKTKAVVGEHVPKTNATQHEEWVKFQQSISVSGFETGQTIKLSNVGGKNVSRGGISSRKKKERLRLEREQKTPKDVSEQFKLLFYILFFRAIILLRGEILSNFFFLSRSQQPYLCIHFPYLTTSGHGLIIQPSY